MNDDYVFTRYEHAGVIAEIVQDNSASSPQDNYNTGTTFSWGPPRHGAWGDETISEPDFSYECEHCEGQGTVCHSCKQAFCDCGTGHDDNCQSCDGVGIVPCTLDGYFKREWDAELVIPLEYVDYTSDSRLRVVEPNDEDVNGVLVFTAAELKEWGYPDLPDLAGLREETWNFGRHLDAVKQAREDAVKQANEYARARIEEYDHYLQGNVWGIVIRERTDDHAANPKHDDEGEVLESCWGFIGEPDSDWITSKAHAMAESCNSDAGRSVVGT